MDREFNTESIIWSHCCFDQVFAYMSQVNFNFEHAQKVFFKDLIGYEGNNSKIFSTISTSICFCLSEISQTIPLDFFTVLNINLHVDFFKKVSYVSSEVPC